MNAWQPWLDQVCDALALEPDAVDTDLVRDLSQAIAREFGRPLGHLAAYVLGCAAAQHPERPIEELRDAILGGLRGS